MEEGKDDHCVTLYGKWLFDSNFDYALPLTKECLDLCCSNEGTNETFLGFRDARILLWDGFKQKKKMAVAGKQQVKKG